MDLLDSVPCARAEADHGETGGRHPALLGAGNDDVYAPFVHRAGEGAEAGDGVHDEELVTLLDHLGDLAERVGDAGGRFVVGNEDGGHIRVGVKGFGDGFRGGGLSPFDVLPADIRAVCFGDAPDARAERADFDGENRLAGG